MNADLFAKTKKLLSALICAGGICYAAAAGENWEFHFRDGEILRGEISSFEKDKTFQITAPSLQNDKINIPSTALLAIKRMAPPRIADDDGNLKLTTRSGDIISCFVKEIDDGIASVESKSLGNLKIPLDALEKISRANSSIPSVIKPYDRKNWKTFPEKYSDRLAMDDKLILMTGPVISSINCEMSKIKISFKIFNNDLSDEGMVLMLFANLDKTKSQAYILKLSSYNVAVSKSVNGNVEQIGQKDINNNSPIPRKIISYEIFADKIEGSVHIIADNKEKYTFTDKTQTRPGGNLIAFSCLNSFLLLSDLEFSEWDGKIPDNDKSIAVVPSNSDVISFNNKDKIEGNLKDIDTEKVFFESSFGKLKVPIERISSIVIQKLKITPPTEKTGMNLVKFHGGDIIKVKIEKINDGTLFGETQFGKIAIDMNRLSEIVIAADATPSSGKDIMDIIFTNEKVDEVFNEEELENEFGELLELFYY
jgi:hypothetical protein